MYDQPVRPESLGLIARGLAQDIFSHTGTSTTLVEGEYDYNAMTGLVIRDLELAMTAEFIRLRMASSAEARRQEADARDDEARKELEQFPDYVVRTPCGEVLPDDFIGCMCDVCNEALTREVSERNALPLAEKLGLRDDPTDESQAQLLAMAREARQVNALSERSSVNAPEGAWCTKCVRFHTLWGCDDLECVYCYEGGHQTLHVPTGMSA